MQPHSHSVVMSTFPLPFPFFLLLLSLFPLFPPPLSLSVSVVLQFAWHSARKSCSALRPQQTDPNAQGSTTINTEVPQPISTCKILFTSIATILHGIHYNSSLPRYDRFGCVSLKLCLVNHIMHLVALLFELNSPSVCHVVSEEICLLNDMPLGACRRRDGFFLRISYG